jgi:hypothetical protein
VKIPRWSLTLILLGLSGSIAMADSVDPKFVPIGGTGSIILTSPTDPAFQISFTKNGNVGTVDCGSFGGPSDDRCINPHNTEFVNFSHQTWSAITLEITHQSLGLVFSTLDNAIDPYFAHSAFGHLENGDAFVTFFGIDSTHPGILSADSCTPQIEGPPICSGPTANDGTLRLYDFSVLSDVNDMRNGQSFTAQGTATPVPEPATVLLALVGGLLLFLFKRP